MTKITEFNRTTCRLLAAECIEAIKIAKKTAFPNHRQEGYGVTRVDHFDGDSDRLIIDWQR